MRWFALCFSYTATSIVGSLKALSRCLFFKKQNKTLLSSLKHRVRAKRRVTKHKNLSAASFSVSSLVNNWTWISSFLAANLKQTLSNLQRRPHLIYFVNLARISASGQIASDVFRTHHKSTSSLLLYLSKNVMQSFVFFFLSPDKKHFLFLHSEPSSDAMRR